MGRVSAPTFVRMGLSATCILLPCSANSRWARGTSRIGNEPSLLGPERRCSEGLNQQPTWDVSAPPLVVKRSFRRRGRHERGVAMELAANQTRSHTVSVTEVDDAGHRLRGGRVGAKPEMRSGIKSVPWSIFRVDATPDPGRTERRKSKPRGREANPKPASQVARRRNVGELHPARPTIGSEGLDRAPEGFAHANLTEAVRRLPKANPRSDAG